MKSIIYLSCFLLVMTSVYAITFTSKADIDLQSRYNILNPNLTGIPAECLLTNSWISQYRYNETTCRTINYTAFPTFETVNSTNAQRIRIQNSTIDFYNSTGSLSGKLYALTGSSMVLTTTLAVSGSFTSDNDIYTTGTGDDIWTGTGTQGASKAILYADGTLRLNGTAYAACTTTTRGSIMYNNTLEKHMGCNSTMWIALY